MLQKIVVELTVDGEVKNIPMLLNEDLIKKALFVKKGDSVPTDNEKNRVVEQDGFVLVTYELLPVQENGQTIGHVETPQVVWCPAQENEFLRIQFAQ